jgi:NNP family nitrate/nitrite transporter-like MFS transporter
MILDRFGPRITYSCLLVYAAIPCLAFALAQNFEQLVYSRLALSIVGCGFVIGIRMVAEWFPAKEIGLAEGSMAAGVTLGRRVLRSLYRLLPPQSPF